MTEAQRRAIKQIRVLWPYLDFTDRYEWVEHFRGLYGDDFVRTVEALSGFDVDARKVGLSTTGQCDLNRSTMHG